MFASATEGSLIHCRVRAAVTISKTAFVLNEASKGRSESVAEFVAEVGEFAAVLAGEGEIIEITIESDDESRLAMALGMPLEMAPVPQPTSSTDMRRDEGSRLVAGGRVQASGGGGGEDRSGRRSPAHY